MESVAVEITHRHAIGESVADRTFQEDQYVALLPEDLAEIGAFVQECFADEEDSPDSCFVYIGLGRPEKEFSYERLLELGRVAPVLEGKACGLRTRQSGKLEIDTRETVRKAAVTTRVIDGMIYRIALGDSDAGHQAERVAVAKQALAEANLYEETRERLAAALSDAVANGKGAGA